MEFPVAVQVEILTIYIIVVTIICNVVDKRN